MKPLNINLGKLGKIVQNQKKKVSRINEAWVYDEYKIVLTAEQLINLIALSKKYPNLVATDEELDKEI